LKAPRFQEEEDVVTDTQSVASVEELLKVVTPPSQWRNRGDLVELPSGPVVRLRRMSLGACLLRGEVPNALASYAKDVMTGGKAAEDVKKSDAMKGIEFMAWICKYALLEPRLYEGDSPIPDDGISLTDLTDIDQAYIARYAQGETLALSNFR
jgi:hypothetical protein